MRLFDLTRGIQKPYHRRRLTAEAKADLLAWYQFVSHFNGKSMILEDRWDSNKVFNLFSDASNIGFGGFVNKTGFMAYDLCLGKILILPERSCLH